MIDIQHDAGIITERWSKPLLADDSVTYMRRPAKISFDALVDQTVSAARNAL
ncbi:hypothetical protein D3C80_2184420 [compost metagenome]